MGRRPHRTIRSFQRFFFLDAFQDTTARPIVIYVGGMLVSCTLFYHLLEGWSLLDSFYFVAITFTTIGYGDFSPTQPLTKIITIFLAFNGVAVLLMLLDEIQRIRRLQLEEDMINRRRAEEVRQRRRLEKQAAKENKSQMESENAPK
ncbi:MAG: potassium channel family protein [Chloroflexota bacterium]